MKLFTFMSALLLSVCVVFPSFAENSVQSSTLPESQSSLYELKVNINTASEEELALILTGVGEDKAKRIVEYREEKGRFASADELANVSGIGPALVEKNRAKIEID